ncbi:hypothetical protein FHW16_002025 [Phyllobacterium myrsinacearum]|uniref:Uncharacterized protein n=1 Tax=Phyllobacterium myrsinacearum TaxID=28101 RepID=A0A839EE18_9HYPH|nr:hypothetical protein [Phyllobacterium myrsinacearum]
MQSRLVVSAIMAAAPRTHETQKVPDVVTNVVDILARKSTHLANLLKAEPGRNKKPAWHCGAKREVNRHLVLTIYTVPVRTCMFLRHHHAVYRQGLQRRLR